MLDDGAIHAVVVTGKCEKRRNSCSGVQVVPMMLQSAQSFWDEKTKQARN